MLAGFLQSVKNNVSSLVFSEHFQNIIFIKLLKTGGRKGNKVKIGGKEIQEEKLLSEGDELQLFLEYNVENQVVMPMYTRLLTLLQANTTH